MVVLEYFNVRSGTGACRRKIEYVSTGVRVYWLEREVVFENENSFEGERNGCPCFSRKMSKVVWKSTHHLQDVLEMEPIIGGELQKTPKRFLRKGILRMKI